jgi:anti-sigma B factor antagonist
MTVAQVRVEHHDGLPVAALQGDVDAANADRIAEELTGAVSNRAPALLVVLTETRYLDSAGINMLFRLRELLGARRQRFGLVLDESAPLRRALEVSGVLAAIPVWDALPGALAGIRGDH